MDCHFKVRVGFEAVISYSCSFSPVLCGPALPWGGRSLPIDWSDTTFLGVLSDELIHCLISFWSRKGHIT